jgi:hypothetical protein
MDGEALACEFGVQDKRTFDPGALDHTEADLVDE